MRILVTDGMAKSGIEALKAQGFEVVEQYFEPEELKEQIKNFDAIVVRSATKIRQPIIDAAAAGGRLKLIVRAGVGVDNIDVDYAEEKGIAVRNTPNSSSASVAELTIGHMFTLARFLHHSNLTMRAGQWNKKIYKGIELANKTLGLIGFGRIARETAKRAKALGMNVIFTDIALTESCDGCEFVSMDQLLTKSDFISLHVPASGKPILGQEEFSKMKDGVFVINCARGGVVCETALLEALDSGKVAGAGIDVFIEEPTKNEKLVNHNKVSVTPHIGASTKEAQDRVGAETVSVISEFFNKGA